MTSEHQAVKEFVIPRKGGNTQHAGSFFRLCSFLPNLIAQNLSSERLSVESSRSLIEEIPLGSEDFRNVYWAMFCKHLSGSQKDRNVTAIHCAAIKNRTLEKKFKAFQKKLEDQDEPSEISYGFYRLLGPPRETELIAQHGLFTGNSFVGDLGDASKGVHLNESPDLVTPSKFLEKTRLQIMAFKVLKGRTNLVGLSSFTLEPTAGCASHTAKPPAGAESLSRHELFRYNQVYLYEENDSGTYANVPANVLPFAVFTVEFPPNTTTTFKYVPFTVWNGGLKVGERRYTDLMLQSSSGIFIRPPFFGRFFEITDLVPWKACLDYPPIIDLLSHQTIGKLSTKKEV
ncbi:unnamed protein product [Toxocara canis]|uniref:DUF3715 domain-containing protein n=1 Tax=Toxocara canis TaxID=6265 RepID=A0A183VDC0_TOXCA|nr:unnamed protein product [Toxocara canis]